MLNGAPIKFELVQDVPDGGVLLAVPALLGFGLLSRSREMFGMAEGFYPLESIFLVLALMALGRIASIEALRYEAPGEWGKLVGLDRIPEVRTLRQKLSQLCAEQGSAQRWSTALAEQWMRDEPEWSGVFYADGHVRVYHGKLTDLPRRYVARERLCLRATTDYWVNAMDGRPFFMLSCAVDPGLLSVLREQIVPRLRAEVPNQPSPEQLEADPLLSRFTIVFDREAYSPDFFAQMKKQRIAILTYRKFTAEPWAAREFGPRQVNLINGEQITMEMAERGVRLSNDLWVREVRHLSQKEHQSPILSTDYHSDLTQLAGAMFARWCQENFFKYMREHYGIDRLAEYGTEAIPDTTRSSIRRGANSTARFVAKTDCSAVNWLNSPKSSCPEIWSLEKSKPMSSKRVSSNRPWKHVANKSSSLRLNAEPIPSTSRSKICRRKIDFDSCVQRKSTSLTRSNSSLTALKQLWPSLPAKRLNAPMTPAH
jgi:hypothetical protein